MLKLVSRIKFFDGNSDTLKVEFNFVNNIEITSTWDSLTDKCVITIPRDIKYKDKDVTSGADAIFKRGDKVIIELGYDGNYKQRFYGYIVSVDLKLPIKITCEDSMYLLKKKELTKKTYSTVSTEKLIKDIVGSNYKVTSNYSDMGQFIIQEGVTVVDVLNYIREKYNLYSFYRTNSDGVPILYVGVPYVNELRKNHIFDVNKNIIENNLTYKKEEDYKIKIKYVGQQTQDVSGKKKDKKVIVWYPSEQTNGSTKTFTTNKTLDTATLEGMAKEEYYKVVKDGYTGNILTFGSPMVNHGDGVTVKNGEIPEQDGNVYLIKEVTTTFGMGGYRQQLEFDGIIRID